MRFNQTSLACVSLFTLVSLSSCLRKNEPVAANDSDVNHAVKGLSKEQALQKQMAIRINQTTSMATLYLKGTPVSKWKVATGQMQNTDENEINPPDGSKQNPTGVFAVHEIEKCPPWAANGKSAESCASNNPLGRYALWFQGQRHWGTSEFGLHGINNTPAAIDSVGPDLADRRASAGCIRNHPNNIEALFELSKSRYQTSSSAGAVNRRYTLKQGQEPVYVVSSNWSTDPNVPDVSGKSELIPSAPKPPPSFPAQCKIKVSDDQGIANVRSLASSSGTVLAELKKDAPITVLKIQQGDLVAGTKNWYEVNGVKLGIQAGKSAFIHSSLVSCP